MRQWMPTARTGGFTLIELMAVIVIIFILFGILMATLGKAQENAKRKLAQQTVATLSTAIRNYKYERNEYPCLPTGKGVGWGSSDKTYSSDNYYIIAALTNAVPPMLNTSGIKLDSNGAAVDPWLSPYVIVLDTDENGSIDGGIRVTCVNL